MERLTSRLGDVWVDGTGPHAVLTDAVTGAPIAAASSGGLDLGAALAHARTVGGPTLRAMTYAQRGALLKQLSQVIHTHRAELIELSRTYGATRGDAKFDIDGASGTLAYYAGVGASLGEKRVLLDGEAEAIGRSARFIGQHIVLPREGVAVHINAFNFPAWGMGEKLAVALLAGMPAIVKPATATALVTWRVVRLWEEAGVLPPGVLSLLCGSAGDLLDHLRVQDVIAFTGSSATAAVLRAHPQVVALGIPVNVEADSLNAAILGPDVEPGEPTFDMFVADVARDLTQKAGQKCTAIRRVFVPADKLVPVRDALADLLDRAVLGDPDARETTAGPVATAAQQESVRAGIEALASVYEPLVRFEGAVPDTGYFVRPRMFVAPAAAGGMVHEDEVFGPVSTVVTWSGDADAVVGLVARGRGGLVASVYSDDEQWAGKVVLGIAPWHGRIHWGSKKVADQSPGPGTVLPNLVHGGPGKAGGGEELGGLRGLRFYQQRTAIQADRALLERVLAATAPSGA